MGVIGSIPVAQTNWGNWYQLSAHPERVQHRQCASVFIPCEDFKFTPLSQEVWGQTVERDLRFFSGISW